MHHRVPDGVALGQCLLSRNSKMLDTLTQQNQFIPQDKESELRASKNTKVSGGVALRSTAPHFANRRGKISGLLSSPRSHPHYRPLLMNIGEPFPVIHTNFSGDRSAKFSISSSPGVSDNRIISLLVHAVNALFRSVPSTKEQITVIRDRSSHLECHQYPSLLSQSNHAYDPPTAGVTRVKKRGRGRHDIVVSGQNRESHLPNHRFIDYGERVLHATKNYGVNKNLSPPRSREKAITTSPSTVVWNQPHNLYENDIHLPL
ncbi:hypothetical protein HOY80DRAFT_1003415 [Tuber brumale]|nr:hypothetical protein HOY80DRAFT_1003415 [Tuber brumale]